MRFPSGAVWIYLLWIWHIRVGKFATGTAFSLRLTLRPFFPFNKQFSGQLTFVHSSEILYTNQHDI